MRATLAHEEGENAICGEMAAARQTEIAEATNTASEPSMLLVAVTRFIYLPVSPHYQDPKIFRAGAQKQN